MEDIPMMKRKVIKFISYLLVLFMIVGTLPFNMHGEEVFADDGVSDVSSTEISGTITDENSSDGIKEEVTIDNAPYKNTNMEYPISFIPSNEEIEKWKQDGSWESRLSYMREQVVGEEQKQAIIYDDIENSDLLAVPFNNKTDVLDANDTKRLSCMQNVMPSTGNVKALVFMVQFEDCKNTNERLTKEYIKNEYFGNGEKNNYPTESLANYYRRSSYGKLNISGEVYGWLDLQHEKDYYNKDNKGSNLILKEALDAYEAEIDFSEYDSDKDGIIDSIYVIYAGEPDSWGDFYWNYKTSMSEEVIYDDVKPNDYVFQNAYSNYARERVLTAIHETGHLLGLEDYYSYDSTNSISLTENEKGGLGKFDMMDGNYGDHNIFSKLLLGWVSPQFVTKDSEINLKAISDEGAKAVIITPNQDATIFSEYYLLELYNDTGNNSNSVECPDGGVRLYHVNAQVEQGYNGFYYFKYNNMFGHESEYKLIKLLESDGNEDNSLRGCPIVPSQYYYKGMEFGPNTAPSSEFYEGKYTGIHLYFNNVEKETAEVSVKFDATDTQKPTIKDTFSYNVLGDLMNLSDYKIFFDSYIYAGTQFSNIKFYSKKNPDNVLDTTAEIINTRHGNGWSEKEPIFKDSISGYNQLVISSTKDLESNAEYLLEIPEGAIKDAYGNMNEKIVQEIHTVKLENNVTYKNYDFHAMPENAPENYRIESQEGKHLFLSDESMFFAAAAWYWGPYNDFDKSGIIVLKHFLTDGSNVLNKCITLQKAWSDAQSVRMLTELKNGNIFVLLDSEYVITDKEGNLITEVTFDRFGVRMGGGCKYINRENFIDIYNYFDEERCIYRVAKKDGAGLILTQFSDKLVRGEDLIYYDENYEKMNQHLSTLTNSPYDAIQKAESDSSWTKHNILIKGRYVNNFGDLSLERLQGHEKIVFGTISHDSSEMGWTDLGMGLTNICTVDKNHYKLFEMNVSQWEAVLGANNIVPIKNGDGYLLSMENYKRVGNNKYKEDGCFILRIDEDCNVKWISLCSNSYKVADAYYSNGKITAVMKDDMIEFEDPDKMYYSMQKEFSFDGNNLRVNENAQSLWVLSDFTIKNVKEAVKGTYGTLQFYDSNMKKVTKDDTSLLGGMIRIDSADGICKWYYKIQKPQLTSSGITVEFKDLQQDAVKLEVNEINKNSEKFTQINEIISKSFMEGTTQIEALIYDIELKDSAGTVVQPKSSVTVKIPVPAGYNGRKCKVYYVNNDGKLTDMSAKFVNGFIVFDTDHFSTYIITETKLKTDKNDIDDIKYGDINSDGEIDIQDVVLLKKYLASIKGININVKACDVNGDGEVNIQDAIILLKHLAGMNVTLGKQ